MSEEQQAQPSATSYDGLQEDQNVIDAMYYSLENLGEPVEYGNNKDILGTHIFKKKNYRHRRRRNSQGKRGKDR